MFENLAHLRLLRVWLAGVALVVAATFWFGANADILTGAVLLALILWPGVQPIGEMLHAPHRRA